jgi:small multidrug resistance pump
MTHYAPIVIAILAEVAATMLLPFTNGFMKLAPSLGVLAGYGAAFYFLSLALRTMPVAIAYALWSGLGTVLVTILSWLALRQPIEFSQVAGILLIVVGSSILHVGGHGLNSP